MPIDEINDEIYEEDESDRYVIMLENDGDDLFLGFGNKWHIEYPDAQIFTYAEAVKKVERIPNARIVSDDFIKTGRI